MDKAYSPDLSQYVDGYLDSLVRDLPSEQDLAAIHVLTARFKRRMQRLVRIARRMESTQRDNRTNVGYRRRLVILVIIIAIMTSVFSISASREAIVGFVVQIYEKFSTINFNNSPTSPEQSSIPDDPGFITDHLPTDLPKGYVLDEQTNSSSLVNITYTNTAGHKLFYIKQVKFGVIIDFDTEGIQTESIVIGQHQGVFYYNKGQSGLIWDDAIYVHTIIGVITKEEVINMANSTK